MIWISVVLISIKDEGNAFRVALTGLVLVQKGFAIVNADDVAKIPKKVFKHDSKAMFIPRDGKPWFCSLVDYITHPEYEYATVNTIAVVELDPEEEKAFPMRPICWPPKSYNTTRDLHAIAFTDVKRQLEKSIYSLQHVERERCDAFYNRVGLTETRMTPTQYVCGYANHTQKSCIWDNGVVLASNTTTYWALIGFGVRGPGCAAPTRFIDITQYFPWIESITTEHEDEEFETNLRKTAFNEGFKKKVRAGTEELDFVHPDMDLVVQSLYPFDTRFIQNKFFKVDRIDDGAILIRNVTLPAESGNCKPGTMVLLYRETTKIMTDDKGIVSYRLSMYDLAAFNYSCTKIEVKPVHCKDEAILYYSTTIDNTEALSFAEYGETPEKILKVMPIKPIELRPPKMTANEQLKKYKPGPHLKPLFVNVDDTPTIHITNYNIMLRIEFEYLATITIDILGALKPVVSSTTPTPTTATLAWLRAGETEEEYGDNLEARAVIETSGTVPIPKTVSMSRTESISKTTTSKNDTTSKNTNKLDAQRSIRIMPASPRLVKERVLFSDGEKTGVPSCIHVFAVEVFVFVSVWYLN